MLDGYLIDLFTMSKKTLIRHKTSWMFFCDEKISRWTFCEGLFEWKGQRKKRKDIFRGFSSIELAINGRKARWYFSCLIKTFSQGFIQTRDSTFCRNDRMLIVISIGIRRFSGKNCVDFIVFIIIGRCVGFTHGNMGKKYIPLATIWWIWLT